MFARSQVHKIFRGWPCLCYWAISDTYLPNFIYTCWWRPQKACLLCHGFNCLIWRLWKSIIFTFSIQNHLLSHFYLSLATNNPIGLRVQFFLPKLPGCVTALPSSIQTRILLLQHQVIAWSTNNSLLHLGSTLILTESRVLMKPFWKTHKYKIF